MALYAVDFQGHIYVEAENEDDAFDVAAKILEKTLAPILVDTAGDWTIEDVNEEEQDWMDRDDAAYHDRVDRESEG